MVMEYPRDQMEFDKTFNTDEDCLKYLIEIKWPSGFDCDKCHGREYWIISRRRIKCKNCNDLFSLLSGTFFEQTNKPLTMWFRAIWWMIAQKNGVSASGLQRILGIGSYRTAWIWLHKLRGLMVFPNREVLHGKIEMDETMIGGAAEGKRGRGAENKTVVAIAVELLAKGTGRVRLKVVPDSSGKSLLRFIRENIEKDATIITDAWTGYSQLNRKGYQHIVKNQVIATNQEEMLPHVHRISGLLKRWLLGTHQNFASPERLQKYLDEFAFRHNRRRSNSRGLLFYRIIEQAILREPMQCKKIIKNKKY